MYDVEKDLCSAVVRALLLEIETYSLGSSSFLSLLEQDILSLSSLDISQQKLLIKNAFNYVEININIESLRFRLNEIANQKEYRELEDTFLVLGAPLCLMRRLFGIHASEFSNRRRILNLAGNNSGRPRRVEESTEHYIWKVWIEHSNLDQRERLLKVSDETGTDLHTIWNALKEHMD